SAARGRALPLWARDADGPPRARPAAGMDGGRRCAPLRLRARGAVSGGHGARIPAGDRGAAPRAADPRRRAAGSGRPDAGARRQAGALGAGAGGAGRDPRRRRQRDRRDRLGRRGGAVRRPRAGPAGAVRPRATRARPRASRPLAGRPRAREPQPRRRRPALGQPSRLPALLPASAPRLDALPDADRPPLHVRRGDVAGGRGGSRLRLPARQATRPENEKCAEPVTRETWVPANLALARSAAWGFDPPRPVLDAVATLEGEGLSAQGAAADKGRTLREVLALRTYVRFDQRPCNLRSTPSTA